MARDIRMVGKTKNCYCTCLYLFQHGVAGRDRPRKYPHGSKNSGADRSQSKSCDWIQYGKAVKRVGHAFLNDLGTFQFLMYCTVQYLAVATGWWNDTSYQRQHLQIFLVLLFLIAGTSEWHCCYL